MTTSAIHEEITGVSLTGLDGAANRTYTLSTSDAQSAGFAIIVDGSAYMQGTNYTLSNDVVTFITEVYDSQIITLDYNVLVSDGSSTISTTTYYKKILYDNPGVTSTTTTTSAALSYGNTSLSVADASSFATDDLVLIESVGNEYVEIRTVSTASGTTITLSSGVNYPHISGITITKLNYDKYRISRSSTSSGTYTVIVTDTLNYADKHNRIDYEDTSTDADDSEYYKIYYYNSVTDTEALQTTLNNEDNYSWIKAADFKAQTGLANIAVGSFVTQALLSGVEAMRDDLFYTRLLTTTDRDVSFNLSLDNLYIADFDGNRTINKNDIVVFEYDKENDLRTYLSHKIVKVFTDNPKIVFSETVPTSGKELVIKVPVAQVPYANYKRSYEQINKLYGINYLLTNVQNDAVKSAIFSWTAGGTTVSREPLTVDSVVEKNRLKIKELMKDLLLKTYFAVTKMRSRRSSLNSRTSGSFVTSEGGRRIYF